MAGSADGGDHGREFSRADIMRLMNVMARLYNTQLRAETFLEGVGFPAAQVPGWQLNGTPADYWSTIFRDLDRGVMPDPHPYHQFLEYARSTYVTNRDLNELHERYGGPGQAPAPPAPAAAALRVLVIGANPLDPNLPAVRADREAHAIERVAAAAERVTVKVVLGAEATDVQRVGSFRPDILHFVCHGTADSMVFCDIQGESDYVSAARVAELLAFYRDTAGVRLRAIVLAACDGQTLAPYFTAVADQVIAHKGKLSDPCGTAFAVQFYTRLNTITDLSAGTLAAAAREAAQLTAQYSMACEPVIGNLILEPGD